MVILFKNVIIIIIIIIIIISKNHLKVVYQQWEAVG